MAGRQNCVKATNRTMLPDRPRALALNFGRRFAVASSAVDSHGRVHLDASQLVPLVSITSSLVATGTEGLPSQSSLACSEGLLSVSPRDLAIVRTGGLPSQSPYHYENPYTEGLLSQSPRPDTEDLPSQLQPHCVGVCARLLVPQTEIRCTRSAECRLLKIAHLALGPDS